MPGEGEASGWCGREGSEEIWFRSLRFSNLCGVLRGATVWSEWRGTEHRREGKDAEGEGKFPVPHFSLFVCFVCFVVSTSFSG